jgi:hypothetical protein
MIIIIKVCGFGQITITYADYQSIVSSRLTTTTFESTDTSGLRAISEQSGSNRIWDIRGRIYSSMSTSETIYQTYPDGAPYANDPAFLGSNIVERVTSLGFDTSWRFYKFDSTGIYFYGNVYGWGNTLDKEVFWPAEHSPFPITFNTSWIDRIHHMIISSNGDTLANNFGINSYYVDGYGTITTPEGEFQCLRFRITSSFYKNSSDTLYALGKYCFYDFRDQEKSYARIMTDSSGTPVRIEYLTTIINDDIRERTDALPHQFELSQNYPNPFNPSTNISFTLPSRSFVSLKIFNVLGREVSSLYSEELPAGTYTRQWNALAMPSGVYYYRLQAGNYIETKKLLLLK